MFQIIFYQRHEWVTRTDAWQIELLQRFGVYTFFREIGKGSELTWFVSLIKYNLKQFDTSFCKLIKFPSLCFQYIWCECGAVEFLFIVKTFKPPITPVESVNRGGSIYQINSKLHVALSKNNKNFDSGELTFERTFSWRIPRRNLQEHASLSGKV